MDMCFGRVTRDCATFFVSIELSLSIILVSISNYGGATLLGKGILDVDSRSMDSIGSR